ncbi:MAG: cysteine--tRNA ligase [Gammaproteobacteria bacterium]|nr:cysteine--tRNA ligase [Gammaproteobacteria bacterium]
MDIHIYDSKQRRMRKFQPMDPEHVTIYVCGPTVYDQVHIGNGLSAVVFDVFVRFLRLVYPKVTYVRNITDIDDKIINAALENDEPFDQLTQRFTDAFHDDAEALFVLPPDVEPRPTLLIPKIVSMIEQLVERGHAYIASGHVLFDVGSFPDYGKLSNRTLEDMIDGARIEVAPYKKDPKDFVLWKPSNDVAGWESPWGRGRPGWHIECSAMIHEHLGSTIDIHGAGSDLMFPHNENELAQGKCVEDGANYVNYWMHNGMLNFGGRKMSKSLGNVLTIKALREKYSGEAIRYAFLTGHYRQSLVWDDRLLEQSVSSIDGLYRSLRQVGEATGAEESSSKDFKDATIEEYPSQLVEALAEDVHTPRALAELHGISKRIYQSKSDEERIVLRDQLLAGAWLLGLLNQTPTQYFRAPTDMDVSSVEELIRHRNEARGRKDFERADAIREELAAQGIEIEDTPNGTRWSSTKN